MSEWEFTDTVVFVVAYMTIVVFGFVTLVAILKTNDDGAYRAGALVLFACLILVLQGCASITPYAAARHIDATPFDNGSRDAWDVGCAGLKYRGQLSASGGYCKNIRGGGMIEASIEYEFRGRDHERR